MVGLGLGLGFSRRSVTRGKVYIADGLTMAPSQATISGAASYANDDFEVLGSGTQGTTTFTRSGGDPLSDLGTGSVFVVMEDASGNLEMNVTKGYTGSDVSLWFPLGITPTKMHQGHGAANGQHLSPKGNAFHAQWIKGLQKQHTYKQKAVHSLWCNDVFTTPSTHGLPDTNIWQPYDGMNNAFFYAEAQQGMSGGDATGAILRQSRYTVTPYTNAQNEGMEIIVDTSGIVGKACVSFTLGGNSDSDTLDYDVLEDGVSAASDDVNAILRRINHVFENVDEIRVRIRRTNSGTDQRRISIGDFSICLLSDIAGAESDTVIANDANVLLLGDSWFDDGGDYGPDFEAEFESGSYTGTLTNEAIGGSTIDEWKGSVAGWLSTHNPDICIIHTGINERNEGMEADVFWGHVNDVVNTITARGKDVLFIIPGATASGAQTAAIADLVWVHRKFGSSSFTPYEDRWPKLQGEFITRSNAAEFTDSDSVINNRNKVPGTRVVERLSDNVDLTPTGTAPADAWEEANPVVTASGSAAGAGSASATASLEMAASGTASGAGAATATASLTLPASGSAAGAGSASASATVASPPSGVGLKTVSSVASNVLFEITPTNTTSVASNSAETLADLHGTTGYDFWNGEDGTSTDNITISGAGTAAGYLETSGGSTEGAIIKAAVGAEPVPLQDIGTSKASNTFTIIMAIRTPPSALAGRVLCSNIDFSDRLGIEFQIGDAGNGAFRWIQGSDNTSLKSGPYAGTYPGNSTHALYVVKRDSSGNFSYAISSRSFTSYSFTEDAETQAASGRMTLFNRPLDTVFNNPPGNGTRIHCFAMLDAAISDSQLADIVDHFRTTYTDFSGLPAS